MMIESAGRGGGPAGRDSGGISSPRRRRREKEQRGVCRTRARGIRVVGGGGGGMWGRGGFGGFGGGGRRLSRGPWGGRLATTTRLQSTVGVVR